MIGKLKGRIDSIDEDSVILDVGGVGYHVFCSTRTLAALPAVGEAAELAIETHVREDRIHLFGFPDVAEREWFRLLFSVQGVGVKMALAILSVFAPEHFAQAIAAKDIKSLTRVSGVGNKLAERLTTELKNKVGKLPAGGALLPAGAKRMALPPASVSEDALSALINLGYARAQAYNAVAIANGKLGGDAPIESLLKESLRELAR
jgi:Holliday junction DNA helicase RuvA